MKARDKKKTALADFNLKTNFKEIYITTDFLKNRIFV
jgi:hypothetical protein